MSDPAEKCPVCGDEMDFYGCIGELRGRHAPIIRAQLEAELSRLRGQAEALAKTWSERAADLMLLRSERQIGTASGLAQCAEELLALVKP